MAINTLFASYRGAMIAPADCLNHEGAPAYALTPKHGLAQYMLEKHGDFAVVLCHQTGQLRIRCEHLPQFNKGPHYRDVHLYRSSTTQHR